MVRARSAREGGRGDRSGTGIEALRGHSAEPAGGGRPLRPGVYIQLRPARRPAGRARGAVAQGALRGLRHDGAGEEGFRDQRSAQPDGDSRRTAMLTLLEEVVLLAVDDKTGELTSAREC